MYIDVKRESPLISKFQASPQNLSASLSSFASTASRRALNGFMRIQKSPGDPAHANLDVEIPPQGWKRMLPIVIASPKRRDRGSKKPPNSIDYG